MRIIISPAKKMNSDTDSLPWKDLPAFLPDTERILHKLREMSYPELKKLWQCNDSIAQLNFRRLQEMDLHSRLTPAVLAYEGIQYQYMSPGAFSDLEFAYLPFVKNTLKLEEDYGGIPCYRKTMREEFECPMAAHYSDYQVNPIKDMGLVMQSNDDDNIFSGSMISIQNYNS